MGAGRSPQHFRWAVGIEGSFIPHLGIDQYEWTQHDRYWREDLALLTGELECKWVRYPLPWHLIEPEPGVFDWSWSDARFRTAEELGAFLIVDLVHFGVPTWLPDAFADPLLPEAIERLARAFGKRYGGRACIPAICPVNEPLITALFCGDVGLWPPYGRGLENYMIVLSRIAQGLTRSIRALRETMPGVEIFVCDSLEVSMTKEPDSSEKTSPFLRESLGVDVARRMQRRHIVTDLVLGRVDDHHPLQSWLRRHGFPAADLRWFGRNRQQIDVLGLDYYPHTEVELYTTPEGYYRQRCPAVPVGIYAAAQDYWDRYRIPLMITETSVAGNDRDKINWLHESIRDVRRLRADGIPVLGYTWWPAIDHVDWDGAMLHQTGHIHPVGIYRLERGPDGTLARCPTELRDEYRKLILAGDAAAGDLSAPSTLRVHGGTAKRMVNDARHSVTETPSSFPVVVHSQIDWMGNWRRPQQIFSQLQRQHPVLYIESPRWMYDAERPAHTSLRAFPHFPNLFVLTLHLPGSLRHHSGECAEEQRRLVAEALDRAPLRGKFVHPIQWFYDPKAAPVFSDWHAFDVKAVIYDCIEEWSAFAGADPDTGEIEQKLLARADLVFCRGERLHEEKQFLAQSRCFHLPDGVSASLFIRANSRKTAVPADTNFIRPPVLGFFGTVDERLDFQLIDHLAAVQPDWNLVFIGPVIGVEPESLPRRPNISWLGGRPFFNLQDYAKGFDVCLLPYRMSDAMPWHAPMKLPEYLIAGRPVISTALPEVRASFGSYVQISDGAECFVDQCRRAICERDAERVREGQRHAAKRPWLRVVREIESALANLGMS